MRLRKITLEGFQSYREREEVDLTGLNLTAIYGKNHAGKSTLISNSIDFALFGRSRSDSVSDVISRGAPRVSVSVEFDLGDATYRITRSRTAKGSPEVILEVSDPREESGWRALTEKNPLMADPEIQKLLGMNAQTAAMTWMVHQNNYGAFCDLLPSKRRDVLAEAFDLSRFAELAKKAEAAKKETETKLDRASYDLTNTQSRIDALTIDGPFPDVEDKDIQAQAVSAEARAEEIGVLLSNLGDNTEVRERYDAASAEVTYFESQFQEALSKYQSQRQQMERFLLSATQRAGQARNAVEEAVSAIWEVGKGEAALESAQGAVKAAQGNVEAAQASLTAATQAVHDAEAVQEAVNAKAPAHTTARGAALGRAEAAKAQATQINKVIASLRESMAEGEGVCISCQRPMSAEEALAQIQEQETKSEALRVAHNEALAEAQVEEATLAALRTEFEQAKQGTHEARLAAQEAQQALNRAGRAVDETRFVLERTETSLEAIKALAATKPEREAEAAQAEKDLAEAQATAEQFEAAPERDEARYAVLTEARDKAKADLDATAGGEARRQELTQKRAASRDRARRLWQEEQRRAHVAQELASLQEPLSKAQERVEELSKKAETYGVLMDAFRPSGIPFMILSGVIEELNEEANDIIADLGDDGLSVLITTDRENRTGGTAEKVMVYAITSDGQTNYSALSGSEQTRVALAIRLGLAQCIARRTGTPIETIVMDECWGMFDDAGKRALMNVLIRLSERFSVFSVSHIPDVTESFPDTIEVDMNAGTSRAVVHSAATA